MFSKKSIFSLFAVFITCFHSFGQTQYPTSNYTVDERYPSNETSLNITLASLSLGNDLNITAHTIVSQPQYGTLNTSSGTSYTYTPNNYNELSDEFVWEALEDNGTAFNPIQYKVVIDITPVNNPPIFSSTVENSYNVDENQNQIVTITVIDYDSDASAGNLSLEVMENSNPAYSSDDNLFDVSYASKSGSASYIFNLIFKSGILPNFESSPLGKTSFTFDLNTTDDGGSSVTFSPITVTLQDVDEAPVILSSTTFSRTIAEGENTETKEDFTPIQINAGDPEGSNIYWTYTLSNANIGGSVKLNGSTLTEGQMTTSSFTSNTNIDFDYIPDVDDYGSQTISFTAYDADTGGLSSVDSIDITFTIDRVDDDPISLNENSAISVTWDENKVGVLHDFDPTDPDSSANANVLVDNNGSTNPEGAKIYYEISGEDEEFFTISSVGELSFLSPPDYENPQDQTGGNLNQLEGNNIYTITVTVRDRADSSSNLAYTDSQDVTITVNNVNELPTIAQTSYAITVTEDNVWSWDENTMFSLIASDVDSGHQANLNWGIKFANDGDFGTAVISGTGTSPDSLVYTPNFDYDGSSGNDIFIVQVTDDANDSLELDFNVTFIPVSDPPRLEVIDPPPNETITISRETYTIPLDENNPSVVRIDYNEVDGDSITDIYFEGGQQILDNEDFNMTVYLAQQYAEISFKPDRIPDFEAPADDNGDGNYSVQLAATESTGKTLSIRLDFIIQNVDDAPEFSPVTNFSPAADENQDFVATLSATDPEGASQFYWKIDPLYDYIWFEFVDDENTAVASNDLKFVTPPNFENPLDDPESGDKNNTYTVQVRISDQAVGGISSSAIFTVRVNDVNDAPVITPIPLNIDEPLKQNSSMELSQYVFDEDNQSGAGPDTISWLEVDGDTDSFALDLNGSLKFNLPSDYETKTSYQILVRASDGRGGFDDANFTIDVNEQSEAPEFFAGPTSNVKVSFLSYSLDEDTSISGDISDHTRDPDTNSSLGLTFSTTYDDSNGTFDLQGPSGVYTFTPNGNYEGTTYIYVTATDGANPSTIPLIFVVSDISDPPVVREGNNSAVLSSQVSRVILENNSTWSMELNASDPYDIPPSSVFLWSLSGPDAPKFKVSPTSGSLTSLTLRATPDFESAEDNDTDGIYDLNVTVTDVDNTSQTFNLLLTVLDDDEPAYFIYSDDNASPVIQKDAGSFTEHTISTSLSNVTVFDVSAQDHEGSAIIYGFTDHNPSDNSGALGPTNSHYNDNNTTLFEINPSTGRIKFKNPVLIDYEAGLGTVSTSKNTYVLEVNATDDTANPDQARHLLYLTIENVVEEPDFRDDSNLSISSWSRTVNENHTSDANLTLYYFSEDDNLAIAYEIVGGADFGKFTINSSTGLLEFLESQNFEDPSDSNGDGIYELEVGIIDTNSTLDLYVSLRDQNDAPEVTNTGLTQIVVPENTGFVVDIDVLDQDSGKEYPDLIFINGSTDVDFISHTGVVSSVADFYNGSSNSTIESFVAPSFVVAADFNEDGYEDVVVLNQNLDTIQFSEFDEGSGTFASPVSLTFTEKGPKYCVVTDLNEDGKKDLIVSFVDEQYDSIGWFENRTTNLGDPISFSSFLSLQITSSTDSTSSIDFDHFAIGDVDGDSYEDIVIARKLNNAVDVYLNDGSPSFGFNHSFDNFTKPNYIDLADFDSSGTSDILVSAQGELSLGYSSGLGTDGNVSVAFQTVDSYPGAEGRFAKVFDLTRDGKADIVYATGQSLVPAVIIQNASGFDASIPLTQNSYAAYSLGYPSDARLIPATDGTRETLVVSDESSQYFSLYEAESTNDGNFKEPVFIDAGSSAITKFVVLSDLNASKDVFEYSFNGGEDDSSFNSARFKNDGKLYFNSPFPDFENPTDNGAANRYDVIVKVEDQDGGSTEKTISVTISDVNDKPEITSLDGNWTSSFDHNESNASLYLFTITATNQESPTESVSFGKSGGADQQFFDVDTATGEVSFFAQPDYETPLDSNGNNSYNIIVRATDAGGAFDEQNVTVYVLDTYEPPVFGKPIISNQGLTTLELDENIGFVVDLDVSDPNATAENPDIVFVSSLTNEIRSLDHTENNSSVAVMYPASGTSLIEPFTEPIQVVAGDFDKDGFDDLIVLDKDSLNPSEKEIHYLEWDNNAQSFATSTVELVLGAETNPSHLFVKDLDQDGDLDLMVSFNETSSDKIGWFENDQSGAGLGIFSSNTNLITTQTPETISHFAVGDVDGDSYDDLVVTRLNGVADIYLNNKGSTPSFTWKQQEKGMFDKPRYVELADFDNSGTLDLLISAKNEVLVGYNQGMGTNNMISFSYSSIGTYSGEGRFAKAYDLTDDGALDVVYAVQINTPPSVVVQSNGSFLAPNPLSLHQNAGAALNYPSDLKIIPEKGQNLTTLVFSDDSNTYLSLYEATTQKNGTFEDPVAVDIGSSTKSFVLSDIGRESQTFQYSFVGGEDRVLFDENRFKDGGKLYFATLPDYEYPTDLGEFNRYDVMVKVEDGNGESTIQSVVVLVNDKNDAPYITSLDGNWTSSFYRQETSTTLDLFAVEASNTETDVGDEKLSYSILPQADHTFFEINSTSGMVSLLSAPDYENPLDANKDNNYNIIIRVTDDGEDPLYDEQNVTIVIQDGPEAPSFGYNITSYEIIEDSTLSNVDLNVTDDDANPAPGPGIDTLFSTGEQNGAVTFNISSTPPTFTYTPDANFSGLESFTINATNYQGLTNSIDVNVTVTAVNDPPEITTSRIINVGEGTQRISMLHANDDSAGEVVWSWTNANIADPDFSLTSTGLLQFNNHGGADYENLTDQVQDFLPTDALNLVLWLDADDNETLYKTFNFNEYAESNESGTSVGGWKDKSTQGADVFINHTGSGSHQGKRPKIGFINGRTAIDFQGDVEVQELRADSRIGLVPNPDLLVFAVTHVDSSVNDSDQILQIGDDGVGSIHPLTVAAGSGGWSWRFNGGQVYYDAAPSPNDPNYAFGIQVWERSSGDRFSSSKFYLNGVEFAGRQNGSDDFPDSTADYLQVGKYFDGRIGEVIVLNSTASEDREKLEGYLAHKWGLTDKLSTAHPYRYNRPTHIKWERSIRVTDSDGNFTDSNFTIRVANQNDNLPVINNPEIQNTTRIYHYEYSELNNVNYPVIDFNVTDIDGDIVEFNIVGGNDSLLFDLNNSSKLSFKSWVSNDHPDFENPKDYNQDSVYEVEIEITDGNASHTITKLFKIEILNGNEDPPEFTYDGAVVTFLELNQTENNKTVIQLTTNDDWTGPIEYSITGGTDGSLFEVNSSTGLLSFSQAPNFEFPHNNLASNDYQVEVNASDEDNYWTTILIEVNVTDINEPPGFGGGFVMPVVVDEDSSTTFVMEIYDPEDPDQTLFPFEFPPKVFPSHGTFTEAGQGQYTYTPDTDYNGDDMIVITVNDANLQKDFNVTFQVNPVADNPTAEDDEFVVELNMGEPIALDVLYNDSNLPDANNTVGLSIVSDSLTLPDGGSVEVVNGNVIHYTPTADFIGTDSFSYTMRNDANLTSTASVKVFVQEAEGLKNWRFLSNFGFYMISGNNWIYHGDLGWVFAQDLSRLNSVSWMWHEKIGWFWTGNEYVPDLYVNDFSSWFRFSSSVANGIYLTWPIYDQEEQEWLNMENYFNKQQNLVKGHIRQALEGLVSNDEIIEYIEAHSFFTKEQIATIKYELKFKGISKTLSSLLEE